MTKQSSVNNTKEIGSAVTQTALGAAGNISFAAGLATALVVGGPATTVAAAIGGGAYLTSKFSTVLDSYKELKNLEIAKNLEKEELRTALLVSYARAYDVNKQLNAKYENKFDTLAKKFEQISENRLNSAYYKGSNEYINIDTKELESKMNKLSNDIKKALLAASVSEKSKTASTAFTFVGLANGGFASVAEAIQVQNPLDIMSGVGMTSDVNDALGLRDNIKSIGDKEASKSPEILVLTDEQKSALKDINNKKIPCQEGIQKNPERLFEEINNMNIENAAMRKVASNKTFDAMTKAEINSAFKSAKDKIKKESQIEQLPKNLEGAAIFLDQAFRGYQNIDLEIEKAISPTVITSKKEQDKTKYSSDKSYTESYYAYNKEELDKINTLDGKINDLELLREPNMRTTGIRDADNLKLFKDEIRIIEEQRKDFENQCNTLLQLGDSHGYKSGSKTTKDDRDNFNKLKEQLKDNNIENYNDFAESIKQNKIVANGIFYKDDSSTEEKRINSSMINKLPDKAEVYTKNSQELFDKIRSSDKDATEALCRPEDGITKMNDIINQTEKIIQCQNEKKRAIDDLIIVKSRPVADAWIREKDPYELTTKDIKKEGLPKNPALYQANKLVKNVDINIKEQSNSNTTISSKNLVNKNLNERW